MKDKLRREEERELTTFQENKGVPIAQGETNKLVSKKNTRNLYYKNPMANECFHCKRKAGSRFNMDNMSAESVFLYADIRGFMVCNFCKAKGLLIAKRKLSKKERKHIRLLQENIEGAIKLPHITLDKDGNKV